MDHMKKDLDLDALGLVALPKDEMQALNGGFGWDSFRTILHVVTAPAVAAYDGIAGIYNVTQGLNGSPDRWAYIDPWGW